VEHLCAGALEVERELNGIAVVSFQGVLAALGQADAMTIAEIDCGNY
jgi:hypothetical protein